MLIRVGKNPAALPPAVQQWVDARKRYHLSHAQVQMARELGLNPRKFGKLANHRQEQWKVPVPQYIEYLYFKRFGRERPEVVKPAEQWRQPASKPSPKQKPAKNTVPADAGSEQRA
jgi:hypothetical protein